MAKTKKAPADIEGILEAAQTAAFVRASTARVPFISQDLRDEHARLDAELREAITADRADDSLDPQRTAEPIARRLKELEDEVETSMVEFRFRGVGRKAWADLAREHPPTKEQLRLNSRVEFNEDTFVVAVIALSCEQPKMTVEQADQLLASPVIDHSAYMELLGACLRANVHDDLPKSLLLPGVTPLMNDESSKQHTTTESLAASSLDE